MTTTDPLLAYFASFGIVSLAALHIAVIWHAIGDTRRWWRRRTGSARQ